MRFLAREFTHLHDFCDLLHGCQDHLISLCGIHS